MRIIVLFCLFLEGSGGGRGRGAGRLLLSNASNLDWELGSCFLSMVLAQGSSMALTPSSSSVGSSLDLSFPVHKTGIWTMILSLHWQGDKFHLFPPKIKKPSSSSNPLPKTKLFMSVFAYAFFSSPAQGLKSRGVGGACPIAPPTSAGPPPVVPSAPLRPPSWNEAIT